MELLKYKGARIQEHFGPNGTGGHTSSKYGSDKADIRTYTFNSAGFRSEELNPDAALKIFVCGCSYTFGTGVNFEKSWPFLFKRRWAKYQNMALDSINLLNFSQGGASNDYVVRTLIEEISHTQIQPDLVIAGFTHVERFELFSEQDQIAYQFNQSTIRIPKWSEFWEDTEERRKAAELYLVATNRDDEVARFAKNVLLLQNYCQSRNIPMIFLFLEQKLSSSDKSPSDFISRISTPNTATLLNEIDTKYCATLNAQMFVDTAEKNGHPGPKSQALIAKSLWKTFRRNILNNVIKTKLTNQSNV
ncbi:MAG: DUF6071 family protein [Cyanobacteria bacterium P01_F01_bin.143]